VIALKAFEMALKAVENPFSGYFKYLIKISI